MTPEDFKQITADRTKELSDSEVIDMYRALRVEVMGHIFKREKADNAKSTTMVAIGEVLEARIGEIAFERLMDDCDKSARPTHG